MSTNEMGRVRWIPDIYHFLVFVVDDGTLTGYIDGKRDGFATYVKAK
jgi:hypothetical protein